MAKYEITGELIVTCPIKYIVEADSKDEALDMGLIRNLPGPHGAVTPAECGWRATVSLKVPKDVHLVNTVLKVGWFNMAGGGEKARKLPEADAA